MKAFLQEVVSQLVEMPEQVSIDEISSDSGDLVYSIVVHESDRGHVIGKRGRMIFALRNLVNTVRAATDQPAVTIEVQDA